MEQGIGFRYPLVTNALVFANLAVFIWMQQETLPSLTVDLVAFGAVDPVRVWSGEIWRLVTALFVHGGLLHFMLNTIVLFQLGRLLEFFVGSAAVLAVFLSCGIAGFCCSLLAGPNVVVGSSGAVFGLVGTLLALFFVMPKRVPVRALLRPLSVLVVVNFVLGAVFNTWFAASFHIDNTAHAGGLALGMLWGIALAPKRYVRIWLSLPALLTAGGVLFGVAHAALHPSLNPDTFLLMGQQALFAGDIEGARERAQRLRAVAPDSWKTFVLRARLAAAEGRSARAGELLARAQRHSGFSGTELWQAAFVLLRQYHYRNDPAAALFADEAGNAALCRFALAGPSRVGLSQGVANKGSGMDSRPLRGFAPKGSAGVYPRESGDGNDKKDVLERCAWLLLMSHDERHRDPVAALAWAKAAVGAADETASTIMLQTLAEAYRQNGELREARAVLQRALLQGSDELSGYLLGQERALARKLQPQAAQPPRPLRRPPAD
ncbi:MAG: rhomboid family intramembrane serine protease [Myxococcota bacterium]